MESLFYGYDLGSHGAKGALYTLKGECLASASRSHPIERPSPGWQEQDPEKLWWPEFLEITEEVIDTCSELPGGIRLAAIGITGFVPGLCAVDAEGSSLRPAIMHTDIRAGAELDEVNKLLPEPISLGTLLPKLLWLRRHEPELFRQIQKVLVPHAWLGFKLTGKQYCDFDTASIYGALFDTEKLDWDREICHRVGVDLALLPDPVPVTGVVGTVFEVPEARGAELTGAANSGAAPAGAESNRVEPNRAEPNRTGEEGISGKLRDFLSGAKLIAGSGDSFAALTGEGAVRPGDMMIYLGTSATKIVMESPLESIASGPHYGQGKASFLGRIFSCGESMEHYRQLLGHEGWKELDRLAEETVPGCEGVLVLPHRKQRGVDEVGSLDRESIIGLETGHGQGFLFRAFLEGVAYRLREDIEGPFLEEGDPPRKGNPSEKGKTINRIILAGGGAKSSLFCRIIASVLGEPVLTTPRGGGTAGMALLAAYALDKKASLSEMAESWFARRNRYDPIPQWQELYANGFSRFQKIAREIEYLHQLIDSEMANREYYTNFA